ncbi:MAG: TonB-dependent receptor plug domain-containing protein [Bacteroidia bacterium]
MKALRGWMLLGLLGAALQALGQSDSVRQEPYDIQGVVIRVTLESGHHLGGAREWTPDSLTLANAQMGNLSDLLREMPSVATKRYAPGGLSTPTLRGTGAGHTPIYWDGIPLNSPMLGQQELSLGAGNLFDRLTVRYGGNSLVLGSGGIGGAIDLKGMDGTAYCPSYLLKIREQFGAFGSNSSNLNIGLSNNHLRSNTAGYLNTARNNFPFRNSTLPGNPVERLSSAGFLQVGGMEELTYTKRRSMYSARLWLLQSDRDLPPTMLTADAQEHQSDRAVRAMVGWHTAFRPYRNLSAQGALMDEHSHYTNVVAGIDAPSGFRRWVAKSDYTDDYSLRRLGLKSAGIRWMHDVSTAQGFSGALSQSSLSGYATGVLRVQEVNYVHALVREEWVDGQWSPFLGYLAGGIDITDGLKASAALTRNYRFPTLNDRFWMPGGNPLLRPELSHSAEIALKYSRSEPYEQFRQRNINAEFTGYYNRVRDWILWLPGIGSIWRPENVDDVTAMGLEFVASKEGLIRDAKYSVRVNYTISSTRDSDGKQLIYTPQHIGAARLLLFWHSWSIGYFQDFNGKRFTTKDNSSSLPGFTTADINIGWQGTLLENYSGDRSSLKRLQNHAIHLQAGVRNIFNAQYQTVAWRPMPGRAWYLRLDISFSGQKMWGW